ncbi:helix-turn-helix domain-containing protein [Paenibacillus qinlingensis]|uniref:helix-turn-helix domain-containing protein n=1 Tax=Paenibacillus qinlingensis TaxID=1837343 RepID=UPI0015630E87|nr:helix-turn-helix domain-containing protein [Paenibacillus qinlingensis]NQX60117.1 helix-turn-helix domain-containing protein [Paenibacillus qinlingensis]
MPIKINLWKKRKSVIFTWLISYSAVFIIPILMSLILYRESSDTLRGEIHRANDTMLQQVRETIDTQIEMMQRLSMELTWNTRVQSLIYTRLSSSDEQYTAYQVAKEFQMYQTSYASVDQFYVTWEGENTVLLPGSTRDYQAGFETIHETGIISYADWLKLVKQNRSTTFTMLPRKDNMYSKQALALITRLPAGAISRPTGSVVVMADVERFNKAIAKVQSFSGGDVYLLDEAHHVLLSNTSTSLPASILDQLGARESGVIYNKTSDEQSEIYYLHSEVSNLTYISVIPSKLYWQKAEYVRNVMYVSVAISLVGAAILTLFFMRRNYSPIQRLVQVLAGAEAARGNGTKQEGNELSFIHRALSDTLSEKEAIRVQLQQQHNMLRSNMLARLLKGRLDGPIPLQEALISHQIELLSDHFAVLLFFMESPEDVNISISSIGQHEKSRLAQFILTNVVEELVGMRGHRGYVAEVGDMLACIVNFAEDDEEGRMQQLVSISEEAQQFLLERYRMQLTLSISRVQATIAGISQAYQEALDAMEYKLILGKQKIIAYDQLHKEPITGYYYPLQIEQRLMNFIKIGDLDRAREVLDEVIERNYGKSVTSVTLVRTLMFNLISTMMKTIHELGEVDESFLAQHPNWMETMANSDTVKEMVEQLNLLLEDVCEYTAAKLDVSIIKGRSESLRELIFKVNVYVETHYQEMDLNVGMLGEQFQLKASYLSKLYKEQTGEGLLDYINRVRIEQAKALLGFTDQAIVEIGKQVGFNEAATFIRVFKKFEGITPGKFRELRG